MEVRTRIFTSLFRGYAYSVFAAEEEMPDKTTVYWRRWNGLWEFCRCHRRLFGIWFGDIDLCGQSRYRLQRSVTLGGLISIGVINYRLLRRLDSRTGGAAFAFTLAKCIHQGGWSNRWRSSASLPFSAHLSSATGRAYYPHGSTSAHIGRQGDRRPLASSAPRCLPLFCIQRAQAAHHLRSASSRSVLYRWPEARRDAVRVGILF